VPISCTPEFRYRSSEDRRIALTAYQIGSRGAPSIVRSPGKHSTVGAKIGRVDEEGFSEVGQRRFSAFKPPVRLRAENEAMRGRWWSDTTTSIRVFERRKKVLSRQRLCGQSLERAKSDTCPGVTDGVENHLTVP
jgi:hypothetical protein